MFLGSCKNVKIRTLSAHSYELKRFSFYFELLLLSEFMPTMPGPTLLHLGVN
jgi:hypothetical protein